MGFDCAVGAAAWSAVGRAGVRMVDVPPAAAAGADAGDRGHRGRGACRERRGAAAAATRTARGPGSDRAAAGAGRTTTTAARGTGAWLRPPTARPGIQCVLNVTQVPGGEVTQVSIGECNGDQAVRESIEAAVYRASPLPPPPDPALFDRNLKINFKPD